VNKEKYSLIFSVFVFALFSWMAWEATGFAELARFFPLYISIAGAVLTLADIVLRIIKLNRNINKKTEAVHDAPLSVLKYIIWIIGYLVLMYLLGFLVATTIFLFAFLYIESGFKLIKTFLSVTITMVAIISFGNLMTLFWPKGLLGQLLGL
jgi:hypothetical protein